ncbi:MAG: BatD family protein [Elusimicrobiota bacterium]
MNASRRALPLLALLLAFAPGLSAQPRDFALSANVDRGMMTLDDQAVLTVTVSGARTDLPEPRLPAIPAFNVHGLGQSNTISFVNGTVSNSVQYRYILVPRMAGRATIGPVTASDGSNTRQTQPIDVMVTRPGTTAPAPPPGAPARAQAGAAHARATSPDLFITAEADKHDPYVNEQVLLTVRFYAGVPVLGNAEWRPPSTQGFLVEDLPPDPPREVVEGGRRYILHTIRVALFPVQPGELHIGAGSVVCQVQQELNADPFSPDFFQRFFAQGMVAVQTKELKTRPISLSVRPLPDGRPSGFSGAVGRLRAVADVDRRSARVGDALNLTVTVDGIANLKSLTPPTLPELPQFRVYDTLNSLNLTKDAVGVRGSKAFKTVLVARATGRLRIPPIAFSYFDPQRKDYVSAQTLPIDVEVTPGPQQDAGPGFANAAAPRGGSITAVAEDIRHVRGARGPGLARAASAVGRALPVHLVPLIVFLICLGQHLYRERLVRDPAGVRFRGALARALAALEEARRTSDAGKASSLLADALGEYLGDKLDCAHAGLTLRQFQGKLRERFPKLPEGHVDELKRIWEEVDLVRFAPSAPGADSDLGALVDAAATLLKALEEELSR